MMSAETALLTPTSSDFQVEVRGSSRESHESSNISLTTNIQSHSLSSLGIKRRSSCHRCGNMRRNPMHCINHTCPQIFCRKCSTRLIEIYGTAIFQQGCPVCMQVCCCSNKSRLCNRPFHCYRKCPASKQRMLDKPSMTMDMPTFIQSLTPSSQNTSIQSDMKKSTAADQSLVHSLPVKEDQLSTLEGTNGTTTKPPAKKRKVAEATHQRASDILLSMQNYSKCHPSKQGKRPFRSSRTKNADRDTRLNDFNHPFHLAVSKEEEQRDPSNTSEGSDSLKLLSESAKNMVSSGESSLSERD